MNLSVNEHGTIVSLHTCHSCGDQFTICPPKATFDKNGCMSPECNTYVPECDMNRLFGDHSGYQRWLERKRRRNDAL